MGVSIWEGSKAGALVELLEAQNHLISHQNAAIDLLASDKRADLVTDVAGVAQLARNGELLEVMDYGDEIHPEWVDGETHYNPAMNRCHDADAELTTGRRSTGVSLNGTRRHRQVCRLMRRKLSAILTEPRRREITTLPSVLLMVMGGWQVSQSR